jgi:hypothetical protein
LNCLGQSWLGRIRASRGIGAALSASEVSAFDDQHAAVLEQIAPLKFTIRHRADAQILRFP